MVSMPTGNATAQANRRRYEELRSIGQGATISALPAATQRGTADIAPASLIEEEEVPGGWYSTMRLRRSEVLRLVDLTGNATPALIAWRGGHPAERMNLADTVKVQWSAALQRGRIILSDMGHVMFSIVEDTCGGHDALVGGSVCAMGGDAGHRNTRANFVAAAGKLGLDRRDIPASLSLFSPVSVGPDGSFAWQQQRKASGDFIDLRAEMDVLVAISNCPHPFQATGLEASRPILVVRHHGLAYGASDPCNNVGAEVIRAFARTNRLCK
jgi:urea carboxylase-associated protein 2